MTSSRGTNSAKDRLRRRRIDRADRAEENFQHEQVPERESAESINRQENRYRDGGAKLHQDQQELAIVAVDQHAAEGAKNQAGRRAAQSQDSQRHRRAGDFVGDPV